jgi:hypothetical protein
MRQWWNYVPTGKITCGHDATTVEMAVGSSLFTREILSEVIKEQQQSLGIRETQLIEAAKDMLHRNAVQLYGYGKPGA